MNKIKDLVPEHIQALSAYIPGKPIRQAQRESGIHCIKMASNENPYGPSPLAIAAIRQAASRINFYPDNDVNELRLVLADHHRVQPEQILVTDGSTALIDIIARTLLAPGLNAITAHARSSSIQSSRELPAESSSRSQFGTMDSIWMQ